MALLKLKSQLRPFKLLLVLLVVFQLLLIKNFVQDPFAALFVGFHYLRSYDVLNTFLGKVVQVLPV